MQLSYLSFGQLRRTADPFAGRTNILDQWFVYGMITSPDDVPKTGSADYAGVLYGTALQPDSPLLQVTGTSAFAIDFAHLQASGELLFFITRENGTKYDLGVLTLPGTSLQVAGFAQPGAGWYITDYNLRGTAGGYFYGPQAAEFGGNFGVTYAPEGSNALAAQMWGVFAAKKN